MSVIWGRPFEHLLNTGKWEYDWKIPAQGSGLYGDISGLNRHLSKIPDQAPQGPWEYVIHNMCWNIFSTKETTSVLVAWEWSAEDTALTPGSLCSLNKS